MTLTEFLLARIAEDEALAVTCLRVDSDVSSLHGWVEMGGEDTDTAVALFSRFNPARVLAECEAKRQIIELHHVFLAGGQREPFCRECSKEGVYNVVDYPCQTLRALAQPYARRPDFRQEWWL
jgi:hypothetical protein